MIAGALAQSIFLVTPRRRAAFVVCMVIANIALSASSLHAQSPAADRSLCPPPGKITAPTDAQKREARQIAEQARQASIVEGSAAARTLFKRAAQLDPTDASSIYALARAYDSAKEPRAAINEYCHFLALTPDTQEAIDVKNRIAALAMDVARTRADAVMRPAPKPEPMTTASASHPLPNNNVFTIAPFMPGLGQYATGRRVYGALVTSASLGALYWGLQSKRSTLARQGGSPGTTLSQTIVERPNLATGVTLATGISVVAAIEAYLHSHAEFRTTQTEQHDKTTLVIVPTQTGLGLGLSVPIGK